MSEYKEVQLNHGQIEGLYLEGWTTFIEKSAYQAEKEAKERALRVLKEARYALYRLKIGVKWDENHEWFGEVYKEAGKLEAGK